MTGPAGQDSTVTVTFCNHNAVPVRVWLAYCLGNTDTCTVLDTDWLRHGVPVEANGFLEIRGIAVESGYSLIAKSNNNGVSVVAYGFGEAA
jgi:hypothetical protein